MTMIVDSLAPMEQSIFICFFNCLGNTFFKGKIKLKIILQKICYSQNHQRMTSSFSLILEKKLAIATTILWKVQEEH